MIRECGCGLGEFLPLLYCIYICIYIYNIVYIVYTILLTYSSILDVAFVNCLISVSLCKQLCCFLNVRYQYLCVESCFVAIIVMFTLCSVFVGQTVIV